MTCEGTTINVLAISTNTSCARNIQIGPISSVWQSAKYIDYEYNMVFNLTQFNLGSKMGCLYMPTQRRIRTTRRVCGPDTTEATVSNPLP